MYVCIMNKNVMYLGCYFEETTVTMMMMTSQEIMLHK